jgi:hypothetical protein
MPGFSTLGECLMLAFDVCKCSITFAYAILQLLPSHTIKHSTESGTFQAFLQPLLFHWFFISTIANSLIESWNVPSKSACVVRRTEIDIYEQGSNEVGENKGRRLDFGLTYPVSDGRFSLEGKGFFQKKKKKLFILFDVSRI